MKERLRRGLETGTDLLPPTPCGAAPSGHRSGTADLQTYRSARASKHKEP